MSVIALAPGYSGENRDSEDRFHGNRLLYINWEDHQMYCSPVCLPLPATMPFGVLVAEVLPAVYGDHPDFARIEWDRVEWQHSSEPFRPNAAKSLAENGLVHKSFIRFKTPGLTGIEGSRA
jgi:phenol hydroxylase P4 protein